jgi:metal-responsive CopG/Arc/MetJ family transcriptional regulator
METISLKLDGDMLKNVDRSLKKHNFSTRTEFIREAIRDKLKNLTRDELEKLTREELIDIFMNTKLKPKKRFTEKEWREAREKALRDFIKEKGWG